MVNRLVFGALLIAAQTLGIFSSQAQETPPSEPSLGDLAKKLRSDRTRTAQKPAKVFTNDDLPAPPPQDQATTGVTPQDQGAEASGASGASGATDQVHDERYYRAKFQELQDRKAQHQRQLAVLEQKLAQNRMQYYPDPNKTLLQEYSRADVNKLTQDIAAKKQEIAADDQAMDDLRDQLRREGGNPGWLRAGPLPQSPTESASSTLAPSAEPSPEGPGQEGGDKKRTKDYWQARFKSARAQLASVTEQQQLVEDELNLLNIQQARELDPAVQSEVGQKITAQKSELEVRRAATAKAQKGLDTIEKEFVESGAPGDWSKTE